MNDLEETKSTYIDFLPSIFKGADKEAFVKGYLKIFEKILTGINDKIKIDEKELQGICQLIDKISIFFHPDTVPKEFEGFIEWLALWVGLVLKEDWSEDKKREVIRKVIPIYRMVGTKRGLEEYLNIYAGKGVNVYDNFGLFQIGVNSQVGISTAIDLTNYFIVEVALSETEKGPEDIGRKRRVIESIINREKPIHTDYKVIWKNVQSMQVEIHSTVEVDTLLWSYE